MKTTRHNVGLFVLLLVLALWTGVRNASAEEERQQKGSIKGAVVDADTKEALVGVNIVLADTRYGAASADNGEFVIPNVPVGSYTLTFSFLGYEPLSVADVIVRPNRISYVNGELVASIIRSEAVVVSGGFFPEVRTQPTSVARFSSEEIRRAPTIGGDISRIIDGLPSLSNENQNNYIVARGGSNVENSFYIDNIRVPNINHFPIPGTTGGGVSLLNIDFIQTVNVFTGGFAAQYGDALSSVMDISYREGNREEMDVQADLNFTGLSVGIEGPLGNGEGSYLFSAKHSFTDILFALIDTDQEPVIYDEIQGKVIYDLSPAHRLSMIHLFGTDRWKILRDEAISRSENGFGDFSMTENVVGVNWRYLWGTRGFSNTSLSHSFIRNNIRYLATVDQTEQFVYHTTEHEVELRNINNVIAGLNHRFEFGLELKGDLGTYDNSFASYTNQFGSLIPGIKANKTISSWNAALFLNHSWTPSVHIDVTPGVRFDYSFFNSRALVSPRLSFAYHIDEKTTLNGAAGLYYQQIPKFFLAQKAAFKDLDNMSAYHLILGFNRLILEDTRLSVEVYYKEYRNCPMDPEQGALFILDENVYNQFYTYRENLVADGRAKSSGLEVMLQKKLSRQLYGFLSGTYYSAKYRGLDGIWRNRITDNRYLFAAEIGYKPNQEWEFSVRWSYAGGIPYSPYDRQASRDAGTGIYETSEIMQQRLPPYSCVNVRVDKRFYFQNSNLIVYVSVWNLLNRENVSYHYWDEYAGNAGNYTQWPRLPVFGFEFEF